MIELRVEKSRRRIKNKLYGLFKTLTMYALKYVTWKKNERRRQHYTGK